MRDAAEGRGRRPPRPTTDAVPPFRRVATYPPVARVPFAALAHRWRTRVRFGRVADDFARMWDDLRRSGARHPAGTGGSPGRPRTRRCASGSRPRRRLARSTLTVDRAGNQWAWWGDPDADGPGSRVGSHLDSVPDGGAFDGPLGVVSAFAAVDALRAPERDPRRPVARRQLRRRGGRALRHRLHRLAAAHRRDDPGASAGAARRATASTLADALQRRRSRADAGRPRRRDPAPHRHLRRVARRAGTRAGRPGAAGGRRRVRSGRTAAGASSSPARRTTPGRRDWPTGATRCSRSRRVVQRGARRGRTARRRRDLRQGARRTERGERDPVRTSPSGSTRAAPDPRRASARSSPTSTRSRSRSTVEESWTDVTRFDTVLTPATRRSARRRADPCHRRRARRGNPRQRGHSDRDAVRPQPDGRLALAGRVRRASRTASPASTRSPPSSRTSRG